MFEVPSVRIAASNAEALILLDAYRFDCIFVDNMMSEKNGLDLTRHIRGSEEQRNKMSAIILCTAFTGLQSIIQARDAGVTEILAKPVSPEQIMEKLVNALFSQRNFIDTDVYAGPDRRRRIRGTFSTNERRKADPGPTTDETDNNEDGVPQDQKESLDGNE